MLATKQWFVRLSHFPYSPAHIMQRSNHHLHFIGAEIQISCCFHILLLFSFVRLRKEQLLHVLTPVITLVPDL